MKDRDQKSGRHAGARILVVDDDENLRRLLTLMITQVGHEPVSVGTLAQARAVDIGEIDVVVSDLHLADGNGLELIARLRAQSETEVGFVMISGDLDPAIAEDVEALGGRFLTKPFSQEVLAEAIQQCLED